MRTLIKNGVIITLNHDNQILKNQCLIIEDDTIQFIGEEPVDLAEIDKVIDIKGNIVMPGLINTHGHGAMSLLRGYGDDLPLQEWLEKKMWPKEFQFKEEHIKWGTQLAIIEMLKTGTTTYSDMYIHMDIVADIVKSSGIRANLSRGIIGIGSTIEISKKLNEALTFAKEWNNKADGRITTMMSPHSAYTCSPEYIVEIANASRDLSVPIQIHMSETTYEVEQNRKNYGERPVKHLQNLGIFENPVLVSHAVHVNKEEIEILKNNNVKISHNPGSNLKLGSGIAPIPEMLKKGLHVSLGTDSAASNNNLDLFEEMRLAALIHKGYKEDPVLIPATTAMKMATIYGAEALFIDQHTGSLEVGKKADLIVVDINQPHFQPLFDPISHLVYTASGKDVIDVFINGEQIVKNREVLTLDQERIFYEVNQLVKSW